MDLSCCGLLRFVVLFLRIHNGNASNSFVLFEGIGESEFGGRRFLTYVLYFCLRTPNVGCRTDRNEESRLKMKRSRGFPLRGESPAGQIFGFADETHTQCTLPLSKKKKMNGRKGEDTHFISFSDSKKQKKEKHGI